MKDAQHTADWLPSPELPCEIPEAAMRMAREYAQRKAAYANHQRASLLDKSEETADNREQREAKEEKQKAKKQKKAPAAKKKEDTKQKKKQSAKQQAAEKRGRGKQAAAAEKQSQKRGQNSKAPAEEEEDEEEEESRPKKRGCPENTMQHPFLLRMTELALPAGFPNKLSIALTHHIATINDGKPDFCIKPAGVRACASTVRAVIETNMDSTLEPGHVLRMVDYQENMLLAQPLSGSIISVLTNLQTIVFWRTTRRSSVDVPFLHELSVELEFHPDGFKRLLNLIAFTKHEDHGFPTVNGTTVQLTACIGGGATAEVITATMGDTVVAAKCFHADAVHRMKAEEENLRKFLENAQFSSRRTRARSAVPRALNLPLAPAVIGVDWKFRTIVLQFCKSPTASESSFLFVMLPLLVLFVVCALFGGS